MKPLDLLYLLEILKKIFNNEELIIINKSISRHVRKHYTNLYNAKSLEQFDDVRTIQKHLKDNNIVLEIKADKNTSGTARSIVLAPMVILF